MEYVNIEFSKWIFFTWEIKTKWENCKMELAKWIFRNGIFKIELAI